MSDGSKASGKQPLKSSQGSSRPPGAAAQKVLKKVESGKVSKDSAAGVFREAALQSAAHDCGELLEDTLQALLDADVFPAAVQDVLRAIVDSGLVDDFAEHVLVPTQVALFTRLRALARRACPCLATSLNPEP